MSKILVFGETREIAIRWCKRNDIQPYARTTYILGPDAARGFSVKPEDRVVFVNDIVGRPDYQNFLRAFLPSLAIVGTEIIERDWIPEGDA